MKTKMRDALRPRCPGRRRSARPSGLEKSGLYYADLRQGSRSVGHRADSSALIRIIRRSGRSQKLIDLDQRRRDARARRRDGCCCPSAYQDYIMP